MGEQLQLFENHIDFKAHKKYRNGVFKTKAEIKEDLRQQGIDKIYYVLSFGGGTQSAHLLEKHLQGEIHYDYIIFSDTGAEPRFIHEQVRWWQQRKESMENKTPFYITNHNSMPHGLEEMLFRYLLTEYQRFQLPVYCSKIENGEVKPAGIMQRQCTIDFKIIPVKQKIRQLLLAKYNLNPRQRLAKNVGVVIDIGFSVDEIKRISTYQSPQFKYMYLAYPLVEGNHTTDESIDFLKQNQYPSYRSRCYLCPFNCDMRGMNWQEIIEEEPLSFLKACYLDEQLRTIQATGRKNMHSIPWLHYSRTPLIKVFQEQHKSLSLIHKEGLDSWLKEWQEYINNKYQQAA